ncbi:MAG: LLM class flavin-dependent oxidoreductase [Solirubrobacteraceae bacterium]
MGQVEIGYTVACEEHGPRDVVRYARRAEEAGFSFALVSDHFHPWIDRQGNSPFAWSVIGAIAEATERLRVGTGVTCPTVRIHPAIVAQAAATCAAMLPGRFVLGVGGRIGDGFVGTSPEAELIEAFQKAGRAGEPCYGQVTVCFAEREDDARRTAHEWWPNIGIPGELGQMLPQPAHLEQAAGNVTEDVVAEDGFFRFYEHEVPFHELSMG